MQHNLSIPIYQAIFNENNEDEGVKVISFVSVPAIESEGIALSKEAEPFKFAALEKEYAFLAPVLVPDKKIFRQTASGENFYLVFNADVIKKLSYKFMKEKLTDVTNVEHNKQSLNNKSYIVESFLVTNKNIQQGLVEMGLEELPLGSWVAKYKVEDKETYDMMLSNKLNGLSVEAFVNLQLVSLSNKVNNNKLKIDMKKENKLMNLLKELKSVLLEVNLASYVLEDGSIIEVDEAGVITNPVDIQDGEYRLADGSSIVVSGKKVVEVKPAAAEPAAPPVEKPAAPVEEAKIPLAESGATSSPSGSTAPEAPKEEAKKEEKMMEVKTVDGKKLRIDEATSIVYVVAEDGSESILPEGEHSLEDGSVIVVDAEGKLVETMSKVTQEKVTALNKTVAELHNKVMELEAKLSSTPAVSAPIIHKTQPVETDLSKLPYHKRMALAAVMRKKGQ